MGVASSQARKVKFLKQFCNGLNLHISELATDNLNLEQCLIHCKINKPHHRCSKQKLKLFLGTARHYTDAALELHGNWHNSTHLLVQFAGLVSMDWTTPIMNPMDVKLL